MSLARSFNSEFWRSVILFVFVVIVMWINWRNLSVINIQTFIYLRIYHFQVIPIQIQCYRIDDGLGKFQLVRSRWCSNSRHDAISALRNFGSISLKSHWMSLSISYLLVVLTSTGGNSHAIPDLLSLNNHIFQWFHHHFSELSWRFSLDGEFVQASGFITKLYSINVVSCLLFSHT